MTVFVTGDYEEKKVFSFPKAPTNEGVAENTGPAEGSSVTVEFDHIRVGSKVRVVCLIGKDNESECFIGVSDEIKIQRGVDKAASVALTHVEMYTASGNGDYIMGLQADNEKSLAGSSYTWYFKSDSPVEKEITLKTSVPTCFFNGYVTDYSNFATGDATHRCTVYCNGTRIVSLED